MIVAVNDRGSDCRRSDGCRDDLLGVVRVEIQNSRFCATVRTQTARDQKTFFGVIERYLNFLTKKSIIITSNK